MQITKVGLRNLPKTLYVAGALTAATLGVASANAQTTQNTNNNIEKVLVISEKGDTTSFAPVKEEKSLVIAPAKKAKIASIDNKKNNAEIKATMQTAEKDSDKQKEGLLWLGGLALGSLCVGGILSFFVEFMPNAFKVLKYETKLWMDILQIGKKRI